MKAGYTLSEAMNADTVRISSGTEPIHVRIPGSNYVNRVTQSVVSMVSFAELTTLLSTVLQSCYERR